MLYPGNERVKLNVSLRLNIADVQLDCKVDNDAEKLFGLVKDVVSRYDKWEELLAPRIILGLWHVSILS